MYKQIVGGILLITGTQSAAYTLGNSNLKVSFKNLSTPKSNSIEPAYQNNISTDSTDSIKVSVVSFKDKEAIESLEKEYGRKLFEYMPFTEKYTDRSSDIHVYDIGSMGKELGLPTQSTKVISQVNETGCRSYSVLLEGNRESMIKLTVKNATPEMIDKPLDATTLKNVVLKALKIDADGEDSIHSVAGGTAIPRWTGGIVEYNPATKTADFGFIKKSIEQMIGDVYMRNYSENNSFSDNKVKAILANFQDQYYKTLDTMF